MKTTVDLSEDLLSEARELAERRGWTVRVVFEESLRRFIGNEANALPAEPFRLQHTVVGGEGLVNPGMTFAEMLEASGVDRRPE